MATRILPGAYVSLNDLSQLPEGQAALNVGYVVKAKRGPVNEATLVVSPTDFLTKFTLAGKPALNDDPTFWDILKVLSQTNSMYVVRAANNPLYGGFTFKKGIVYGDLDSVGKGRRELKFHGTVEPAVNSVITIRGTGVCDGYYTVESSSTSGDQVVVVTKEEPSNSYTPMFKINAAAKEGKTITVTGNASSLKKGDKVMVKYSTQEADNKLFTVASVEFSTPNTIITVDEEVEVATDGNLYVKEVNVVGAAGAPLAEAIKDPDQFEFAEDDLMLITGTDPGAYNGDLTFEVVSAVDNSKELPYHVGADLGTGVPCTFDTMKLTVKNALTNNVLETFVFSRDKMAKTIDGISLYVEDVVAGSAYIKIRNNEKADEKLLPGSTTGPMRSGKGSDGDAVTSDTLVSALEAFKDKIVPISILGNGSSAEAESALFQQALLEVANTRKDCMVFLNSRQADEIATIPSTRAMNIVNYKKGVDEDGLGSVSFYGTMYCPHVKTTDTFNNRQVKIGAGSVAISGWLNVINSLNYPYAYAGPKNGQVVGVTTQWKIGDESGEAQLLNDASVNYVAYDGKVGRYYMQCQNTLQIANSSMRNVGTVLNVLDIKEHFAEALKEYLQLPITYSLRRDIMDKANDYLAPMIGVRFADCAFQDTSSENDIADNTLRYLLTIAPTPYSQKIYLVMNIVNATFDFSILQSL